MEKLKCLQCLLELFQQSTALKGQRADVFRAKDAITIVCGDACCEVHLAQAIIDYASKKA